MKEHTWWIPLRFAAVFFLCYAVTAPSVFAQEGDLAIAEESGLTGSVIGLGVAAVPDFEGSSDYEAAPLLQARFNWANGMFLSILGNSLRANIIPSPTWDFGPIIRLRKAREDVDNEAVDKLEDVDAAVELGAFTGYRWENVSLLLSALQDVSDAHDGYLVEFSGAYSHPIHSLSRLIVFASMSYASDDYMETYFEVTPEDSLKSGIPTFNAEGGVKDVAGGLALQWGLNENWGILGVARYARLIGDGEDSPIVDEEGDQNQFLGGLLVNYRFR